MLSIYVGAVVVSLALRALYLLRRKYQVPNIEICAWCEHEVAMMCLHGPNGSKEFVCRNCVGV